MFGICEETPQSAHFRAIIFLRLNSNPISQDGESELRCRELAAAQLELTFRFPLNICNAVLAWIS